MFSVDIWGQCSVARQWGLVTLYHAGLQETLWNQLQFGTLESILPFLPLCCIVAWLQHYFQFFVFQKHFQTAVRLDAGSTAEHYYPSDSYYEKNISGVLAIFQVTCF